MKRLFFLVLIVAGNVFAFEPRFQVDYSNFAWGYDNKGCLIDREGNVYAYSYGHSSDGKGIVNIGKVSASDFARADKLAQDAQKGKFTQTTVGADGGTTVWTATTQFGQEVKLKSQGDFGGSNSSPAAAELVSFIDGACKQ